MNLLSMCNRYRPGCVETLKISSKNIVSTGRGLKDRATRCSTAHACATTKINNTTCFTVTWEIVSGRKIHPARKNWQKGSEHVNKYEKKKKEEMEKRNRKKKKKRKKDEWKWNEKEMKERGNYIFDVTRSIRREIAGEQSVKVLLKIVNNIFNNFTVLSSIYGHQSVTINFIDSFGQEKIIVNFIRK